MGARARTGIGGSDYLGEESRDDPCAGSLTMNEKKKGQRLRRGNTIF